MTTYDAGMAVPDWPGTYGKNLFLYPYQTWLFGPFDLFIEHGHRLLGAVIGFLAIIAVVVAWVSEPRRWVRRLAIGMLMAVIGQGVLGGMRVVLSARTLAMAHGCTAPILFAICVSLAVVTSRWWWERTNDVPALIPTVGRVRLAGIVTVLAYVQLLLGAQLRHVQVTSSPGGFTHVVAMHIVGALMLWLLAGILAWQLWRMNRLACRISKSQISKSQSPKPKSPKPKSHGCGDLTLSRPSGLLVGFITVQIALGLGTWIVNYGCPRFAQVGPLSAGYLVKSKAFTESIITTAHVATGSLILVVAVMIWLRLLRARFQVEVNADGSQNHVLTKPRVTVNKRQGLQV